MLSNHGSIVAVEFVLTHWTLGNTSTEPYCPQGFPAATAQSCVTSVIFALPQSLERISALEYYLSEL